MCVLCIVHASEPVPSALATEAYEAAGEIKPARGTAGVCPASYTNFLRSENKIKKSIYDNEIRIVRVLAH